MALWRCATTEATIGPVPVAAQIREIQREKNITRLELARRLAAIDGSKVESKRRWLIKLDKPGRGFEPTEDSIVDLEKALEVPAGTLERPVRNAGGPSIPVGLVVQIAQILGDGYQWEAEDPALLERLAASLERTAAGFRRAAEIGRRGVEMPHP